MIIVRWWKSLIALAQKDSQLAKFLSQQFIQPVDSLASESSSMKISIKWMKNSKAKIIESLFRFIHSISSIELLLSFLVLFPPSLFLSIPLSHSLWFRSLSPLEAMIIGLAVSAHQILHKRFHLLFKKMFEKDLTKKYEKKYCM